jgi:hypothetical protein
MKSFIPLVVTGWTLFCGSLFAQSEIPQGLVSTGRVVAVSPQAGDVALRVDQTGATLVFQGLGATPLFFNSGQRASFADVQVDRHVTVYYSSVAGRWVVGKVLLADPPALAPLPPVLTRTEEKALEGKAANDRDITTQPGSKARIDNDITTKPGSKDPAEHDITRLPAR